MTVSRWTFTLQHMKKKRHFTTFVRQQKSARDTQGQTAPETTCSAFFSRGSSALAASLSLRCLHRASSPGTRGYEPAASSVFTETAHSLITFLFSPLFLRALCNWTLSRLSAALLVTKHLSIQRNGSRRRSNACPERT